MKQKINFFIFSLVSVFLHLYIISICDAGTWKSVSCGEYHTIAIKTDGTLWAWGNNSMGQLGLGDNTDRNTPTQVGTDTNWSSVSCGYYHTLAIKTENGT
ncbi:MAG: hypothetical protein QME68_07060, partial [Elusimicrobiota bacterium]|nr:hypothetical protein [Elusimicrobiota bacterium]